MDPDLALCLRCKTRPRKPHHNSTWCDPCAEHLKARPAHRLTEEQIGEIRKLLFTMPREDIAKRVNVSLTSLKRWARDEKIRLAFKNKWRANPTLTQEILSFYIAHGRRETEKRYPGVRVRSIVEKYGYGLRSRQERWTDSQIIELTRMAGIISQASQARYFNRPRAHAGSISSAWIKRFGIGGGRVNGLPHWVARHFVKPETPILHTAYWTPRNKRGRSPSRRLREEGHRYLILWVDFEKHLLDDVPDWLREAAAGMATFQRWLHGTDQVQTAVKKMIRERETEYRNEGDPTKVPWGRCRGVRHARGGSNAQRTDEKGDREGLQRRYSKRGLQLREPNHPAPARSSRRRAAEAEDAMKNDAPRGGGMSSSGPGGRRSVKRAYGEIFYAARVLLDMTQTELANELRISQSCLSKIESDRLEPSASHLLWLLNRLLGVNALAELDVVLVPARLQIEQKDLQRDHAKKLHRGKFIEKCGACVGEKTAKLLIAQNSSDLQAGLSSQLGKTLRPATA